MYTDCHRRIQSRSKVISRQSTIEQPRPNKTNMSNFALTFVLDDADGEEQHLNITSVEGSIELNISEQSDILIFTCEDNDATFTVKINFEGYDETFEFEITAMKNDFDYVAQANNTKVIEQVDMDGGKYKGHTCVVVQMAPFEEEGEISDEFSSSDEDEGVEEVTEKVKEVAVEKPKPKAEEKKEEKKTGPKKYFISYCWAQKEEMRSVKELLTAQGHSVLIDETNDDATLASMMVKMIKECDHAVCIISPEYKKSENCQREFDFINIKKKKISLLFLITTISLRMMKSCFTTEQESTTLCLNSSQKEKNKYFSPFFFLSFVEKKTPLHLWFK